MDSHNPDDRWILWCPKHGKHSDWHVDPEKEGRLLCEKCRHEQENPDA